MQAECGICGDSGKLTGRKNGCDIYACGKCGTFFVSPLPNTTENLTLYSDDYFTGAVGGHGYADYDRDKQVMVPTFLRYLDMIEKVQPAKGTMVDVGAATGFFLKLAVERGWNGVGIEPSAYASEVGRAKGLDVRTGIFTSETMPPSSVDVMTLWDVLEHVPDPKDLVNSVYQALRPGGVAAINTPDSGSLLARALGPKWHLVVPPEHLFLLNMRSLRMMLADGRFEILFEGRIGKQFTIQYAMETLYHWQKLGIWKKTFELIRGTAIGRVGIPINLHDNMFILARKR